MTRSVVECGTPVPLSFAGATCALDRFGLPKVEMPQTWDYLSSLMRMSLNCTVIGGP